VTHSVLDKIAKGLAGCAAIAGKPSRLAHPEHELMLGLRRPTLKSIDHLAGDQTHVKVGNLNHFPAFEAGECQQVVDRSAHGAHILLEAANTRVINATQLEHHDGKRRT
jgi:hypothetical protein